MEQIVKMQEKVTSIPYSKYEATKLFSCLSTEIQDELLAIMRKMVADNKVKQAG